MIVSQLLKKSSTFRSGLISWIISIVALVNAQAQSTEIISVTDFEAMERFKVLVSKSDNTALNSYKSLLEEANEALGVGPYSVVDKTGMPPSGDKHDYLSFGPYWWPNPDTPDHLPYIRRDGEVNPETRNEYTDYNRKNACFKAIGTLGQAFYYSEERKYSQKALALIDNWFVDPETKMNPNLNFGQGIPGRSDGRPYGIIEFRILEEVIKTLEILKRMGNLPASTEDGMYDWMTQFVNWLQTSELGVMEGTRKNNHATWYDVQVCNILIYLGEPEQVKNILEAAKSRIATQIEPDGSQPLELARTKSFSYSTMNLAGFTELARLGKMVDVDLWNYETENGRSIRKAYEFLMPYIATDKEWPYPELSEPANYQERFRELLGLAGQEFDQEFLESLAAKGAESGVQSVDTIYLWTGKVPGESEGKYDPIQSSNTSGNVIRLTDVTNPALIVFEPEQSLNNGAGVIICPGGGYRILAIDKEGYEVAQWLNGLGFTAFVLQYRVPNKRKEALYDIQRAIRLIRYRASLWDLDPNKLGVLGFSAGGSLSARASTGITMDSYTRLDDIDSISYRPDFAALIYPAYLDEGENSSLTPELVVNDNTPPMFIFGTADDSYGNSSLVMAAALRDKMVPVELHLLPAGGHGYGMRTGNIAAETWPVLAEAWLNKFVVNK